MSLKVAVKKSLILIFLFLFFTPSFSINTKAILTLEVPTLEDVPRTWSSFSLLYDDHYHDTSDLSEELDRFNNIAPDLVDVEIIGSSYTGKYIYSLRITNELRTQQKAKTLVVAHHHGREQISVEVALRFIRYLLNNYGVDSQVTEFVNTQEIYILPTINPDALDLVVNDGMYWLRKNVRPYDDDGDGQFDEDSVEDSNGDGLISMFYVYEKNGGDPELQYYYYEGIDNDADGSVNEDMVGFVDLNRNYDMFFRDGNGWVDDTQATRFPGFTAFSEPETQVFRDFALGHRFAMAYSLHSGGNATLLPGSSLGWNEPTLYDSMFIDYAAMLPESYDYFGYGGGSYLTEEAPVYAAGVWSQWMYFERGCTAPMSYELYGNATGLDPIFEVPIIDNSTHLITEWKELKLYYGPAKEYIENLWQDVFPAFPYLLENIPRLSVDATLHSIVDRPRSLTNITFTCTNLSPKLNSSTEVEILNMSDVRVFENGYVIDADSTIVIDATIPLPSDFDELYEIKIGNEFTGYHHFTYRIELETSGTSISFSVIGVMIIFTGLLHIIIKRKKKN
jgi:hypothetical protein